MCALLCHVLCRVRWVITVEMCALLCHVLNDAVHEQRL